MLNCGKITNFALKYYTIFMNKAINSPFRYAGGKFYARKLILDYVPQHANYIEIFAGGASIFFAKPKVEDNWLNDIDQNLVNCYEIIKNLPHELIYALKGEVATKERHAFYKNEFKPQNDVELAVRWFYLNRTSYSGIMNIKNCYFGYGDKFSMRPENWGANIERTAQKLQGVKLTSFDFEEVIANLPYGENTFLFIDPPYYNADQDKFYTHAFTRQDHLRLANVLKENAHKFKFLLTYDNCVEIRGLYEWALTIDDKEWNYAISRTDDQKHKTDRKGVRSKGQEIFIANFEKTSRIAELELPFKNPKVGVL